MTGKYVMVYLKEIALIVLFSLCVGIPLRSTRAAEAARHDTVVLDLATAPPDRSNFNIYNHGMKREIGAHQAMWEPLFLLNYETGQIEPWLALSLIPTSNTNPTEWVLTLRRGVTWSDGKRFTADDVVFTVNELVLKNDSLVAQEAVTLRQQLAEPATRMDEFRVRFKLRYPNPRFARENFASGFFSSFLIMPKHVWEKWTSSGKDPADFKFFEQSGGAIQLPIGTGPYKLKEASQTRVVWERDSGWWGAKPSAGGGAPFKPLPVPVQLEWRVLGSDAQSKAALEQDQIDAGREMTLAAFRDAQAKNSKIIGWDGAGPLAWNDPCSRQLEINTQREPWSDPRLRRAVSLIIDRKALAAKVYEDTTLPSRTLFPEYGALSVLNDAVAAAGYGASPTADLPAADALIVSAGWSKSSSVYEKGGQTLSVSIAVDFSHSRDVAAAREVAQQLVAAGINAKTDEISKGEFWGQLIPKGGYEMAFSWLGCGSVAEPYKSMARYAAPAEAIGVRSPGFNNTGRWNTQGAKDYARIVTDELGAKVLAPAAEKDAVVRAYKYLYEEMPIVPLVQSPRIIPFNTTYWKGWPTKGAAGVPMHSWSATHRLIHSLRK